MEIKTAAFVSGGSHGWILRLADADLMNEEWGTTTVSEYASTKYQSIIKGKQQHHQEET